MSTETYHEEFARMGEPAVEELFVRQGRDRMKRIYAVRWLGEAAHKRLAAEAMRKRAEAEQKIRMKRALRVSANALMLVFGSAAIAVLVLRTAVFH